MFKKWQIKNRISLIKWFTHTSAAIIVLLYNDLKDIPFLISLILAVLFASYFRQLYLVAYDKSVKYKWISTAAELIFIIFISFIDKTGINILFFFACLSETILYYEDKRSGLLLIVPFLLSKYPIGILHHSYKNLSELLVSIFIVNGVPIVFVAGTSYYLRLQINEKEKLSRVNAELEQAYKNLLDASATAEKLSIEKERIRMAQDIHDTLAHTLTTLIVQLEVCKKLSTVDISRLGQELEKAQELTRSGLNDVKRTIKSLRPQALEGKPFFESVLDFINNTMNNSEVHIILNNNLPQELKLSTGLEITIFRLIQESITNSIRHGYSKEIQITLNLNDITIIIQLKDNGTGCSKIRKGFGLTGIQERIEALGGAVDFSSTAGKGFETKAVIPLKEC